MDTPFPTTPRTAAPPASDAATLLQRRAAPDAGPSSCILDDDAPSTVTLPLRFGKPGRNIPTVIGAYRILREIGCGGMGVVYEGFDPRLKRRAAIKMIRSGAALGEDAMRRFQTEAEAVAQIQHPNIVQIYEVGWHDDQPFVALEYLGGGSLHAKAANKPQPSREAAGTVATLAAAMQSAHASGVIHRDLKPANILYSDDGVAKITDFGAARLTAGVADAAAVTQVGEVIGTPQYMAPEQARGTPESITPAVDVYALGALLYHLLTGRPPHDGADPYHVLSAVLANDPVPPRRLVPGVPRDLEIICLKALEKHPLNRYRDAAAMGDDLQRYLNGESIAAKPDPGVVRLLKKARRRPVVAGLVVGIITVALAGFAGVLWQWNKAELAAKSADHEARIAQTEKAAAEAERDHKQTARYHSDLSAAAILHQGGNNTQAQHKLAEALPKPGERDIRHFEWHHLDRLCFTRMWRSALEANGEPQWPAAMAVHPGGKKIAISAGNPYHVPDHTWDLFQPAQLFIVDLATGTVETIWTDYEAESVLRIEWLGEDELLVLPLSLGPKVYRVSTRTVLRSWPIPVPKDHPWNLTHRTVLSPDARRIGRCESPRTFAVYDTANGAKLWTRTAPPGKEVLRADSLTDDGHLVAFGEWEFVILHMPTGGVVTHRAERLHAVIGDPPRKRFFLRSYRGTDNNLECIDDQGRTLWRQTEPRPCNHFGYFRLSPDGETLVELGYQSFFRTKRARDGQHLNEVRCHRGVLWDALVTPDGRDLVTSGNDATVRVWRLQTGEEVARFRGHATGARVLALAPNGWQIVSGGMDGSAMAWDYTRERDDGGDFPPLPRMDRSGGGAYSGGVWITAPHHAHYLDTSQNRLVTFDPHTYTPHRVVELDGMGRRHEKSASDFSLTADGMRLAGPRGVRGPVCLWDALSGTRLREFGPPDDKVTAAALSPDGIHLAASFMHIEKEKVTRREFMLWETATGRLIAHRQLGEHNYSAFAFRPGTRELHIGVYSAKTAENGFRILNLDKPDALTIEAAGHPTFIRQVAFSPDGRHRVYIDLQLIRDVSRFGRHDLVEGRHWEKAVITPVTGVAVSPDGRRIAAARHDDVVTIYDAEDGGEVLAKQVPSQRIGDYAFPSRVAFGPDNRSLVANSSNGTLSVWQTDDWTTNRDAPDAAAARYREASAAEWAFHHRAAWQSREKPDGTAYKFHAARLDALPPPNDYLKDQWRLMKIVAEFTRMKVVF